MTPTDIATLAKQKWNATTDTFYSDTELYTMIYAAQVDLATEARCIRNVYSTTTVIGQQEYAKPTNCLSIQRVTYDGQKLYKITVSEDDDLTNNNQTSTTTGRSQYYWEWSDVIELRYLPDSALTLKMYTYDLPSTVTAVSTLSVPVRYHVGIADYLVGHMATKDKNFEAATYYNNLWAKRVNDAKRYERSLLRGDSPAHVVNEERMLNISLRSL